MKFLDLFAGIGGFRLGMERAGHECVGYVEFDKFARRSYEAMHDTEGEWTAHDITGVTNDDIRQLRDRGHIDVICGGFPCQAFSIAGQRKGFDDTRGTLFFDIMRFADIIRPQYLFLENVRGLMSHDGGDTFETILRTMDELGYDAEWDLLNSKDFGVPQNRERVFIIGHLRGASGRKVFPVAADNGQIDGVQGQRIKIAGTLDIKANDQNKRVYDAEGISLSLTTMQGGGQEPKIIQAVLTPDRLEKRQNGRRFKEHGEPMFTLTSQDRHGVAIKEATKKGYDIAGVGDSINLAVPNSKTRRGRVGKGVAQTLDTQCEQATLTSDYRIRKLTPKECFRLQGFPDDLFDKAQAVNSDSQLYKQAGNSVTVNVIHAIAKRL